MYAKCGRIDLGHLVFSRMKERDSICWNSIITSCSQNGKPEVAIDLFPSMGRGWKVLNMTPSAYQLLFLPPQTCLLCITENRYAKCGNLDLAQHVFDTMESNNEVSWNSIIAAYGDYAHLKQCPALFHRMEDEGFQPDHVTFLAILSAFGHSGQVEKGKCYFNIMTQNYRISPRTEHYACLIDMLGRYGRLEVALQVIKGMPFAPDAGIWGTLSGVYRVLGNLELAEMASDPLFNLEPQNSGYYMLLSNLHADSGKSEWVHQIRHITKELARSDQTTWLQLD